MSGSGSQRELTRNKKVDAMINNEYLTRQRVAQLERDAIHQRWCIDRLEKGTLDCTLWGRLRWLVLGKWAAS